jgi:hypothetical protein
MVSAEGSSSSSPLMIRAAWLAGPAPPPPRLPATAATTGEGCPSSRVGALFTTLFCSQNTVQLMTASMGSMQPIE